MGKKRGLKDERPFYCQKSTQVHIQKVRGWGWVGFGSEMVFFFLL
jgi:hypothetical protein